ncbi:MULTISPECIES: SCP2 sterol-binding domain-containing protein [Kribbella]|uniref:SCP2 sterol-binding domain-containing protein n=1 Tax=Kribbella TaxID=182639 RepID=UPI0013053599|nr:MULTISPECIES: SCP2 sterol-binding domain-containing protein [Kribbella]
MAGVGRLHRPRQGRSHPAGRPDLGARTPASAHRGCARGRVGRDLSPDAGVPAISVRTDPATLLKIVTGNEDPVLAVLKQRLSVRGDLAPAARLTKLVVVGPTASC